MVEHREPSASGVAPVRRQTTHEEIAQRARTLWEHYGQPCGRDEQIWLEAERQLRGLDLSNPNVAAKLAQAARSSTRISRPRRDQAIGRTARVAAGKTG